MLNLRKKKLRKEPLFILLIFFVFGIFAQDYFSFQKPLIFLLFITSVSSLLLFWIRGYQIFRLRPIILGVLFFNLGITSHFMHSQIPEIPLLKNKENLVFKISKKLNSNERNRRYEITAWKDQKSFQSVLSYSKDIPDLDFEHYYQAEVYLNPLDKPYSDFQFDYRKYLSRKGISLQSYISTSIKSAARTDLSWSEKIRQRRLMLLSKIDELPISKPVREFTKGIILADRTEMDQGTVRDFRDSGMMHILAISGTHMAIIFGVILVVLNLVIPPKLKILKIIIALILIWSFAVFIDFGNSVVRSCVMISSYYIFVLLQNKTDLLHSMALAGFVILIGNTNQLFDVGFQLSFVAVLGICWFNQPILNYLPRAKSGFQNFMLNILSISIAAQLATTPFIIYYFHQYSFISIAANLVIIPFAEILIIFSLIIVLLVAFSIPILWLFYLYDTVVIIILKVIHYFAEVDFAMHRLIPLQLLELVLLLVILYFLRFAIKNLSIKTGARLLYFVIVFISVRMMLNYRALQMNEVLVHRFFKEQIISEKFGNRVVFYLPPTADQDKVQQYIVSSYLTSRRLKDFEIKILPDRKSVLIINGKEFIVGH